MDPITLALLIGAGTSLISGVIGSNAADKAAKTQATSIDKSTALQAATIAQARQDAMPWMDAGKTALSQYMGELGLSKTGANGQPFESQFTKTPGYDFAVSEANKGTVNNFRALGLGGSGAAIKALGRNNAQYANQAYQQYLDRLSGVSTGGQTTEGQTSAQSIAGSQSLGQGIRDAGAATASGYVGSANAWTNALGNFANNTGATLGNYDQSWKRIAA